MPFIPRLVCVFVCLTVLASCASNPRTYSATSDNATFSDYLTFNFVPEQGADGSEKPDGLLAQQFKNAARAEMEGRGYRYTQDNADLSLGFFFVLTQSSYSLPRPGSGARCTNVGSGSCIGQYRKDYTYTAEESRIRKVALVLHMVDMQNNQVAWEGMAVGGRKFAGADSRQVAFEKVTAIFTEFPYSVTP